MDTDLPFDQYIESGLDLFRPAVVAIHSGGGISFRQTIDLMIAQRGQGIRFRMLYPNWTLGSDDRRLASDAAIPELDKPLVRRSRAILHAAITMVVALFCPLLVLHPQGRRLVAALPAVWSGTKTWVGYTSSATGLSPLKPGVVPHVTPSGVAEWDHEADRRYASRWHADLDVYALLRRQPVP
jgi:hypothetical protein